MLIGIRLGAAPISASHLAASVSFSRGRCAGEARGGSIKFFSASGGGFAEVV